MLTKIIKYQTDDKFPNQYSINMKLISGFNNQGKDFRE